MSISKHKGILSKLVLNWFRPVFSKQFKNSQKLPNMTRSQTKILVAILYESCPIRYRQPNTATLKMRNTDWHMGSSSTGLHSATRAGVQRSSAVCLADMESQNWKITIGQFFKPFTKSYIILDQRSPRHANKVCCDGLSFNRHL